MEAASDLARDWSLGEITSLSVKAARGLGLPWGLAEEAGWAVRCLERNGLPGGAALAGLDTSVACPLCLGCAVSDLGAVALDGADPVSSPLLVLAFLTRVSEPTSALQVALGSARAVVSTVTVEMSDAPPAFGSVSVLDVVSRPATRTLHRRVRGWDASVFQRLEALAARTYAPASELSRRAGAGAGLTDND